MYPNPAPDPLAALAPHKEMAMLTFFPSFAIQDSNLPLVVVDDMRGFSLGRLLSFVSCGLQLDTTFIAVSLLCDFVIGSWTLLFPLTT